MSLSRKFGLGTLAASAAVLFLAATRFSVAATITDVEFSGPGGTGYNPFVGYYYSEPSLNYSAVSYIDVALTVDSAGQYNLNEAPGFGSVINNSGVAWSGFTLTNETPSLGLFISNQITGPWEDFSSKFSTSSGSLLISMSGAILPSGNGNASVIEPTGDFTTNGPGTFIVREIPVAAPEPTTLTLVLTATAGLGIALCVRQSTRQATAPRHES